jgi:glycosyltransferase involved in cell wall biosynthesis
MSLWICAQIGAREHYAIPRALHHVHQLELLLTDAWAAPSDRPFTQLLPKTFKDRYHVDLATAAVKSFQAGLIAFELPHKIRRIHYWETTVLRDRWFQQRAIRYLDQISDSLLDTPPILFSYSYAALDLLRYAKKRGWKTVLGQIDPGLVEENIVAAEHAQHPGLATQWQPTPAGYWQRWQQECAIADYILVNSHWSQQALTQVGVCESKIQIVPLAYEPPAQAKQFSKTYPQQFTSDRPLKVLFLGQILLRKGLAALLEAAQQLQDQPIEFSMVGSLHINTTQIHLPNVRWIGPVPRSETAHYYQQADVFLFPSLSDGFGLTQLEAQAWQLPIIASQHCGQVVTDRQNGLILPEVSGRAIAALLQACMGDPALLSGLSQRSKVSPEFSLSKLSQTLQKITLNAYG